MGNIITVSLDSLRYPHLEAGVVAGPAALVAAVEETVREQRQVAAGHALAADLGQLALLDQLPARPDELPVTQAGLQLQHRLELVLQMRFS